MLCGPVRGLHGKSHPLPHSQALTSPHFSLLSPEIPSYQENSGWGWGQSPLRQKPVSEALPGCPASLTYCITMLFCPQASWAGPAGLVNMLMSSDVANTEQQGSLPMTGPKSILIGSHDRIKCFCCNIVLIKAIVIFKMWYWSFCEDRKSLQSWEPDHRGRAGCRETVRNTVPLDSAITCKSGGGQARPTLTFLPHQSGDAMIPKLTQENLRETV